MAETMKIMGLHEWIYDLSWWLIGCFTFTFIAVGITYMSSTTFLPSSDPSLLLVFFLLFTLGEINFALLISCFFNRAKVSHIGYRTSLHTISNVVYHACYLAVHASVNDAQIRMVALFHSCTFAHPIVAESV
jgi:hypothetical protein